MRIIKALGITVLVLGVFVGTYFISKAYPLSGYLVIGLFVIMIFGIAYSNIR